MVATCDIRPVSQFSDEQERIRKRIVSAMGTTSSNALAKTSGVDRRTIDRLRSGERFPGFDKILALGRALSLDMNGDLPTALTTPDSHSDGDALTLTGFLQFVRSTGMDRWAAMATPSEAPTLTEAMAAALHLSASPALSNSDGAPIDGWRSFFADLRREGGRKPPARKAPSTSEARREIEPGVTGHQDLGEPSAPKPARAALRRAK